jgi:hypothetical protein
MKIVRILLTAIMAGTALLAGASTALAATSSAAGTANVITANAARTVTASATESANPSAAAALKYLYWSSYPTLKACNSEGAHLFLEENILYYKCPEYNEGDYFVYKLYVVLGHPPGS